MPTDEQGRWYPTGYRKVTYQVPVDAVAYVGESADKSKYYAIFYCGKRTKHDGHYRFSSDERRSNWLVKRFENRVAHHKRVEANKKERADYEHTYQVGEILVSTWGYEQTNVDFYQVTAVPSKKTIRMRKIAQMDVDENGCWAQEYVYPKRDHFLEKAKETLHRVQPGDWVRLTSYSSAKRWDYDKVLQTSYA